MDYKTYVVIRMVYIFIIKWEGTVGLVRLCMVPHESSRHMLSSVKAIKQSVFTSYMSLVITLYTVKCEDNKVVRSEKWCSRLMSQSKFVVRYNCI